MTFLPHSKQFRRITAVATDMKRKTLAVCVEVDVISSTDKGTNSSSPVSPFQVMIYSLSNLSLPKKTRTLTFPVDLDGITSNCESYPIVTCCFSEMNGLFVGVTEAPQSRVIGWQWQKNKIVFSQGMLKLQSDETANNSNIGQKDKVENTQRRKHASPSEAALEVGRVRFHPDDSNIISTSGPTHMRLWRIMQPSTPEDIKVRGKRAFLELQPSIKRMPVRDQEETYNDHTWTVRSYS